MKKRDFVVILALMLALLMVGCSKSEETADAVQVAEVAATVNEDGSFHLPIVDEPKTFTIFLTAANMPFDQNWAVWKEAGRRTNINFEGIIPMSNSNESEAFNLMLSSGELADVIGYMDSQALEKLGRDGGLIPLNDLIDKYAPNLKAYIEENPSYAKFCYSLDGNIYQIPKSQELLSAEYWWIRKDWLDNLGLEVPTTIDELHDVLYAFRNDDPNGNGLKDEIPLFDRAGWRMPDEYLWLWDSSINFYGRDGKIYYEPLEPNFKTAVTEISRWYKEGLIDPEIFTRGPKSRDILLAGNLGGCTHDWVSAGNYNTMLSDAIPGFRLIPMAPPANQHGEILERATRYPVAGWGISSNCKDPISVIKFFDYLFSEDGTILMNWGIEGETWEFDENGNRVYTDTVMNAEGTPLGYLRSQGIQYRVGMRQLAEYEFAQMTDDGLEANLLYESHHEWFRNDAPPHDSGVLAFKYPPELESEYMRIMSNIQPYVNEKFQSWMLGTADFESEYDAFCEELHRRGIDRAIEINQVAFDIYNSHN